MKNINIAIFFFLPIFIVACTEDICLDNIDDSFTITEEMALSLSENALKKKVSDIKLFEPVPFRNDGINLFAQNAHDKNSGYVLWHEKGKNTKLAYSVSIKKKGAKIYCDAGKTL